MTLDNVATEEAQAQRIQLIKGKKVLFITCETASLVYKRDFLHYKRVLDLGPDCYVVVGTDASGQAQKISWVEDGLVPLEKVIEVDLAHAEQAGKNIALAVKERGLEFDGIFAAVEHAMCLVGEVGELLGVDTNSFNSYISARDKRVAREICLSKGVPAPKFIRVFDDNIDECIKYIGFPLILKPSSGAASEGVYKCTSKEEVVDRYNWILKNIQSNILMNWNPGCDSCVLMEEFIEGDEFDVDVLLWNGESVYCNVIDNWPTIEPYFMETGSNMPSAYSPTKVKQLQSYAIRCVQALGFKFGLFHVEVRYSMKNSSMVDDEEIGQPLLIEVNTRMGGGRTYQFHKEVWGVDIFLNFFMSCLNIPINPPRPEQPLCAMADYEVSSPTTGILLNTDWLNHVKEHKNVIHCLAYGEPGQRVKGYDTGIPSWIGLYVCKGETVDEVLKVTESLFKTLTPPILGDETVKHHLLHEDDIPLASEVAGGKLASRKSSISY